MEARSFVNDLEALVCTGSLAVLVSMHLLPELEVDMVAESRMKGKVLMKGRTALTSGSFDNLDPRDTEARAEISCSTNTEREMCPARRI